MVGGHGRESSGHSGRFERSAVAQKTRAPPLHGRFRHEFVEVAKSVPRWVVNGTDC